MLKRYLEQRHIDLDSGRSCLALEREYWQALEVLAYEDGWNNWRDFFYMRVLPDKPEDISLSDLVSSVMSCWFRHQIHFFFKIGSSKSGKIL